MMDIARIRADFPILEKKINGHPLVYLDNAATTHKPRSVLDRMEEFYTGSYGNAHRGSHYLSDKAGAACENARETVRDFINAERAGEIIFTRGTTESINLVASSFGEAYVREGDEIIISEMEHHSNIVPWQRLCARTGARLKIIPFDDDARLDIEELDSLLGERTRIVSVTYVSNALGTVNDIKSIIEKAHRRAVPVMIDGAQAVQHTPIDVRELDCDFFAFSGHKLHAGTGIGVLYGKEKWLEAMPPYQTGGGMIQEVGFNKTTFNELPLKFEAGTGSIAAAVSLEAAIQYLKGIGLEEIYSYENDLMRRAQERLDSLDGVKVYGRNIERHSAISFNMDDIHPFDAGAILDKLGIAVRAGKHCADPVMRHLGVPGTLRASFALYNTTEEIDILIDGLKRAMLMLKPESTERRI